MINSSIPWMRVAIHEADVFEGKTHKFSKLHLKRITFDYHGLGAGYIQFANWCAAFVSYCIKGSGVTNAGFKGTACSQDFLENPHFIKIDKPLYGAVAVWTKKDDARFGHVSFTAGIGKSKKDDNFDNTIVALGGNQSETIKYSPFIGPESTKDFSTLYFSGFFFPKFYSESIGIENIPIAPSMTWDEMEQLNKKINKLLATKIDDQIVTG